MAAEHAEHAHHPSSRTYYLVFGALFTILPVAIGPAIGTPLVMGWLLHRRLPWPRALIFGGGGYAITHANYTVDFDLDRDGDVDATDLTIGGTTYPTALTRSNSLTAS